MATWSRTPPTNNPPLAAELARRAPPGPLWLAYSGGLDSTVLLHLLVAAGLGERLGVVHVDHRLHADSPRWAEHCVRQARALGLACRVEAVTVAGGEGMEANARAARYQALSRHAVGGTLITAHHRDDQAETLLLRLLRGAGPAGLAAIAEHGRWGDTPLWRPLLAVPRAELRARAERHGWCWIEDPSNGDTALRRNYLRQEILPQLTARWPAAAETLARAAQHQSEAAALLAERAREDAAVLGAERTRLPLGGLAALSPPRRR
jgi:tRNA(Ile)-lysidine synthase